MDWMKIGTALLLLLMVAVIWPRARHMLKHSPEAKPGDWSSVLLPIGAIVAFIALLIYLVSN